MQDSTGNQLAQPQQKQDDYNQKDTELDLRMKRVINQLFLRMSSIYGNKWTKGFASQEIESFAKREWYDAVVKANLSPEQVRERLDQCRDNQEWPPTISEFIQAAKPPITHAMHREIKNQLPPPQISEEKMAENMAKLRAILPGLAKSIKPPY